MVRSKQLLVDVRPLRAGAFRRLWAAGIVTALGAQLTAVVVPLQIYEFSGSSAYVGLAGLVGLAPMARRRCGEGRSPTYATDGGCC